MARFVDIHPVDPQPRLVAQVADILRDGGLAAMIDNHLHWGAESGLESTRVAWRRVLDPGIRHQRSHLQRRRHQRGHQRCHRRHQRHLLRQREAILFTLGSEV